MSLSYIRLYTLLIGLLPAAFAILVIGVGYVFSRIPDVESSLLHRATAVAESLALAGELAMAAEDEAQLEPLLASAFATPEIVAVRLLRADGSQIAERHRPTSTPPADYFERLMHGLFSSQPLRVHVRVPIGSLPLQAGFGVVADAADGGEPSPIGTLEIEVSLLGATREQLAIVERALLTGLLLFAATALFAMRLGRALTRPLLDLSETVNALTRDEYHRRSDTRARGELRVLRDGINRMAGHIQLEQDRLQHKVREATEDLQRTIVELHEKTVEAEEQRRAAEQASAFKSRFVANVSHEIRTPLNAILGYAELLERQLEEPHQRHQLATLQRSANSLMELLNDLLDFSRLESGNMPWVMQDVDLNELLDGLREDFASQAQRRGIEYVVANLPAHCAAVCCDPLRLRQTLTNLISNAIKFTRVGHVALSADCLAEDERQLRLRFCVADTGIGIAPANLQTLFTAFSQGDMSTSREYGGTGLGLHIFSEIVDLMNGEIIARSGPGEGSTFGFVASFERRAAVPPAAGGPAAAAPEGVTSLLLVDDYPPLRDALAARLTAIGYAPLQATAGDAAGGATDPPARADGNRRQSGRHGAAQQPPACLVNIPAARLAQLDIPPAGHYRSHPRQRVLALIGAPDELLAEHCERLGYDAVLSHSLGPAALRRALDSALGQTVDEASPGPAASGATALPPVAAGAAGAAPRVLVVDDQSVNRHLLQQFLDLLGAEAVCASSGQIALDRCRTMRFDLILLDLHMPGLDGFAVARQIRAQGPVGGDAKGGDGDTGDGDGGRPRLPILAVTADSHPKRREQARAVGIDDLLVKPVSLAALEQVLQRWCPPATPATVAQRPPPAQTSPPADLGEQLLELLLRDLPYQSERLLKALQARDVDTLAELGHALDGNARFCEAPQLREAAAALAAAARGAVEARSWNPHLQQLCDTLLEEMAVLLRRHADYGRDRGTGGGDYGSA